MDLTDPNRRNLLVETLQALLTSGRCEEDILWAGSLSTRVSWPEFRDLIRDVNYVVADHGQHAVAPFLVVCGDGWWLEREGVGLEERWSCRTVPLSPAESGMARVDLFSLWYRTGGYARDRAIREAPRLLPVRGRLLSVEGQGEATAGGPRKLPAKAPARAAKKAAAKAAAGDASQASAGEAAKAVAGDAAKAGPEDVAKPVARGPGRSPGKASEKTAPKASAMTVSPATKDLGHGSGNG
ncbi:MAG: hypothetical protein LBT40_06650 [Deltaproteobacteria bacterium]|jgi:hypothetical protein|nr:hypothetical protein [Deltaproteobacteria bacterium]